MEVKYRLDRENLYIYSYGELDEYTAEKARREIDKIIEDNALSKNVIFDFANLSFMKDGDILQIGTPQDIYNEPKNAFIADFIGESNIIDGIMHEDYLVEFAGYIFDCVDKGFESLEKVDVVIRPEDIIVTSPENANISGLVESAIFKGVHYEMILDAHGYKRIIHSTEKWEEGSEIGIDIAKENIHIMKREVEEVLI